MSSKHRLIFVDDDRKVLEAFRQHLRKEYDVSVADSGPSGLELLSEFPSTAVVISDMRMPGMDGPTFLSKVKDVAPDTVRVLLTGYTDFGATVRAVNQGEIFRFASKLCPPPELRELLRGCIDQYELQKMEKTLLNKTLAGSVNATIFLLDGIAPGTRARISRIRTRLTNIALKAGLKQRWQFQLAAAFSQFPTAALTSRIGAEGALVVDAETEKQLNALTLSFANAVTDIPRLDKVGSMLSGLTEGNPEGDKRARLLGAAIREDALIEMGYSRGDALNAIREGWGEEISALFEGEKAPAKKVKNISLGELMVGMTLAEDLRLEDGTMIGLAGSELNTDDVKNLTEMEDGYRAPIKVYKTSST